MSKAAWISIVGIGEDGLDGIPATGRAMIDNADVLLGGKRHLAMIPENHPAERLTWRVPLLDTVADLRDREGKAVCVLATGDPMSYGIGVTLGREFGAEAITVLPAPGAFSLAAARMGWPLEDVTRLTLHGRPLSLLKAHLHPRARLMILSENGDTPADVAEILRASGYGPSRLTVLEHMAGVKERTLTGIADSWRHDRRENLNTICVECIPAVGTHPLSSIPGLPDDCFQHDGQMTKREVRAATLSALSPYPGALLWDVGAGCGSVAIEWMRAGGQAIAIEKNAARVAMIADNAVTLGVPALKIITGAAPAAFADLEIPDAIFIGGNISAPEMAEICWDQLKPGGRLVANAVTLESEARLTMLFEAWGGEMNRIAVSRLTAVGLYHGWKPFMPVTQYAVWKPKD